MLVALVVLLSLVAAGFLVGLAMPVERQAEWVSPAANFYCVAVGFAAWLIILVGINNEPLVEEAGTMMSAVPMLEFLNSVYEGTTVWVLLLGTIAAGVMAWLFTCVLVAAGMLVRDRCMREL